VLSMVHYRYKKKEGEYICKQAQKGLHATSERCAMRCCVTRDYGLRETNEAVRRLHKSELVKYRVCERGV